MDAKLVISFERNRGEKRVIHSCCKASKKSRRYLNWFFDIDVSGATIVDAKGMGQILASEVPIFSGLRDLMPGGNMGSHMIMAVVDEDVLESAEAVVNEVFENSVEEGGGVMFSMPISRFKSFNGGGK